MPKNVNPANIGKVFINANLNFFYPTCLLPPIPLK